ncbi:unnamed protein product [Schistosoma mattheei]|uniref:Uncharacterized protein n=1 Tax=Schistosoma mattheei TaxID=31246 RepID=A0A3P8FPG2_9TREM|nr:unnamed protein product [Schistosoma mattheei]
MINEKFSQMDHSNKGDCITETPKRISRVRKASEISDSTTLYKNKPRTTSLPLNDLLTSSFLQAFRAHHVSIYPDLNQIIEMAVSDIQGKQETMDSMEKSFISSSEKFNQTLENLYNETDSKLIQEEELMRQRQQIDESKENVKELQTMKKVESIKKEKADVTACHKIQEEREILMKKLNELREINRCLRDLKDETSNDKDLTDYDRILSPEAFHVNENKNEEKLLKRTHFNKLPIRLENSIDEESEEMKYKEDIIDNNSKRPFELNDSKSLIFKVLLIGSLGVGKQALLNRLSSNSFEQPLDLDEKKNNITISSSYEIKIVIYQHTLIELEKYYYTSKENQNQIIHKPIYMILGNKKDLIQTQPNVLHNKIPDKCITDFVNDLDGTFFEISAKSGENVQEAIDVFLR